MGYVYLHHQMHNYNIHYNMAMAKHNTIHHILNCEFVGVNVCNYWLTHEHKCKKIINYRGLKYKYNRY